MSVLIKTMLMPNDCNNCPLKIKTFLKSKCAFSRQTINTSLGQLTWCPLIEVKPVAKEVLVEEKLNNGIAVQRKVFVDIQED